MNDHPTEKVAVVLFNLGGPDSLDAVQPFLFNLFNDPAIIGAPGPVRWLLAKLISTRRAPVAQGIYKELGGKSPLLELTEAQAQALDQALSTKGVTAKSFIAMRYWHPMSDATAKAVKDWAPDRIVLLPLYPQFSTTTSGSSIKDWHRAAVKAGLRVPTDTVCCYPTDAGWVAAQATLIRQALEKSEGSARVLFSAHGLPKKVVAAGDPYQWQVEQTAAAVVEKLAIPDLDWNVCYQSRVGPLEWIGPSTDAEIERAGADQTGVVVVPIAFVSEHSETLVELDIEYRELAEKAGVKQYLRVPAVGTEAQFIDGLADIVMQAQTRSARAADKVACGEGTGARLCPGTCGRCPQPA